MKKYRLLKRVIPTSGKRIYTIPELGIEFTSVSRDYVACAGYFLDANFGEAQGEARLGNRFGRLDLVGQGESANYMYQPNSWVAYLEIEDSELSDPKTYTVTVEAPANIEQIVQVDEVVVKPQSIAATTKPTKDQFDTFQNLYDFLNKELFNDELNNCILTMIPSRTNNGGHFWAEKWHKDGKNVHEISMNPHGYAVNDSKFYVSILAHEMAHMWIHDNSEKPPRSGYHCKKWGAKMKEIGLYPSNTGEEGGKETGQQMTHYILEDGLFAEVYERMDESLLVPFKRYKTPTTAKKKSKVKYTCPCCSTNIWGKPELTIKCMEEKCDEIMESED